jgi:hypothetical protein
LVDLIKLFQALGMVAAKRGDLPTGKEMHGGLVENRIFDRCAGL